MTSGIKSPSPIIAPPTRFTGLHAHTGFSVFDGLGYPADHIDFVINNGMDSWALTDHGNASGHAHARKHFQKLKKKGVKYRQLFGVEFYFVPSLSQWAIDYQRHKDEVKAAREAKKAKAKTDIDAGEEAEDGHVIEDEEATRKVDPNKSEWKRRYHLVVIAKNQTGLNNLYTLVKRSYKYGFYRYPRIDFEMLKEHGEGLIVSTACLGGIYSNRVLRGQALDKSFEEIQSELSNLSERFVDAVGVDNFFLELQFNKLSAQHDVNKHLLEHHSRNSDLRLVATADSHYYHPDLWEARELYRGLGWGGKKDGIKLPTKDELKCELYPKNAQQMWDEYLLHRDQYDFYKGKDELIKSAIERTHDIAWEMCDDTWIDTSVKLPNFTNKEKTAFEQLLEKVREGMVKLNIHDKPEYIERIKTELKDIKYLGFENYFLVMNEVFHLASNRTLFGCGRGSAAGSLVNYALGITQVDPIKYGLLWARFLGRHRCLEGSTLVMTKNGPKRLDKIRVGDLVLTHTGELKPVTDQIRATHDIAYKIKVNGEEIVCAPNHKWIVERNGKKIEIMACELQQGDNLVVQ